MDFIKKNRMWITIAGCALAAIGCFMPFAKATVLGYSETINFVSDGRDGIIVIIAVIISAVLVFLKKEKFSLIPTGIAALVTIYDGFDVTKDLVIGKVSLGFGFWVILLGLIVAIVCPLLPKEK